jgi:hypothetical protein
MELPANKMHQRIFGHDPRLNGLAYGFCEMSSQGAHIIGHGGDFFFMMKSVVSLDEPNRYPICLFMLGLIFLLAV